MNKDEFISKLKAKYQDIKQKIILKFKKHTQASDTPQNETINQYQNIKNNKNVFLLAGLSIGFIFGTFVSSFILYFKIKHLNQKYEKVQQRLNILSSRMNSISKKPQASPSMANINNIPPPDQVINTLPSSNAFASFYIEKLNQKKLQLEQTASPPKPPQTQALPPLSKLIKNTSNPQNLSISMPPPLPEVNMIICTNSCYAISPSGQVYNNGYQEGDYKLVVNQNQVYWEKMK